MLGSDILCGCIRGQQTRRLEASNGLRQAFVSILQFMKRFYRYFAFPVLAASLLMVATAAAQRPSPTPPPTDEGGQIKTFEVRLPVTVLEKKQLVSGLGQKDFQVFEDGVQQEVTFFTSEKTNPPVYVGVL